MMPTPTENDQQRWPELDEKLACKYFPVSDYLIILKYLLEDVNRLRERRDELEGFTALRADVLRKHIDYPRGWPMSADSARKHIRDVVAYLDRLEPQTHPKKEQQ